MYVALYARVSTTRQAEKDLSIPDQLNQMREWCTANNHVVVQEFIEPGASATDDKRPVFQQMVANATTVTPPYQAIVVHSRSRFFRDLYEFLFYERRLKRSGCKVLSITQQTSDDPAGEMASKIFSLFDEYSSKENGKHTLRAMKENAKRNYFNGSRPCYGYRAVDCFMDAEETKRKKRVEIDPEEANIVREIFNLYLNGKQGRSLGILEIAKTLNDRCITIRGSKWSKSRIHEVLTNRAYIGEYYFNKRDHKTRTIKPESEWIPLSIEPIIDLATFEIVRIRRESRAPDKVAPRILNSPTLLTGLLKCGICGGGLTTATGKSGRYKYYKCNKRTSQGKHVCDAPALPMDKLDAVVMDTLLNKVLVPERLKIMLGELQARQKAMLLNQDDLLKPLQRELEQTITGTNRLYEAVEQGKLPLDDLLQRLSP